MDNSLHARQNKYCAKCLSILSDKIVRDYQGREFCSNGCRKDWYAENRKEMNCIYNEWTNLDDQ